MIDQSKSASAVPENQPRAETHNDQGHNPYREEAARYRKLGLATIPLKARSKEPALRELKPYLSRQATPEEIDSWKWEGVGIVTGDVSGVLVLDVDGPEGEAELKRRGWTHSATATVKTGKGQHNALIQRRQLVRRRRYLSRDE